MPGRTVRERVARRESRIRTLTIHGTPAPARRHPGANHADSGHSCGNRIFTSCYRPVPIENPTTPIDRTSDASSAGPGTSRIASTGQTSEEDVNG